MSAGKSDRVFPHYSTHAAAYFLSTASIVQSVLGVHDEFELFLAQYLSESIKFLLPDNGYLFAVHDYKPTMFELQRLPYPMCALEFTAGEDLYNAESGLAQSTKRIALCFDPHALPEVQKTRIALMVSDPNWEVAVPAHALCVISVFEAQSIWSASTGMVLIDLEQDHPRELSTSARELAGIKAYTDLAGSLGKKQTKHGLPALFLVFNARCTRFGISPAQSLENLYIDLIDETRAVYEFLAAVNCANVGTHAVAPPSLLNAKRIKKGKVPFYAYHVLDIDPFYAQASTSILAGSHAAPRTHLRRGHIRRLGKKFGNKILWINATVVNSGTTEGIISKDYTVCAKP